MKENRVVIPSSMEPPIACMTHIRVSAQRSNVQDALCIGQSYTEDDITEIVQTCRLRLPKIRQQEAQNSRTADFSNTADGNSAHRFGGLPGQHTLVTVHYFSGFLAYDILKSKANSHKSCVQHLQEVWKINSHNGPCLKFRSFWLWSAWHCKYYVKPILQSKGSFYHWTDPNEYGWHWYNQSPDNIPSHSSQWHLIIARWTILQ